MAEVKQLPKREEVPVELTWDLTKIYATDTDFEADFAKVKKEAENFPQISVPEQSAEKPAYNRMPRPDKAFRGNDRIKMKTMGKESVMINRDTIDLRYLEQIADSEQVAALGYCVRYAQKHLIDGKKNLIQIVDELEAVMQNKSLAALCESTSSVSCMAVPRRQEIFACLNRYRGLNL